MHVDLSGLKKSSNPRSVYINRLSNPITTIPISLDIKLNLKEYTGNAIMPTVCKCSLKQRDFAAKSKKKGYEEVLF